MHCSLPEVKEDNPLGMGIYYTRSKILKTKIKTAFTEFGQIVYLAGNDAIKFYSAVKLYDNYSKLKRQYIMTRILPDHDLISNENHLTFRDMNTVQLGCYSPVLGESRQNTTLLPITCGPRRKAYLVNPTGFISLNGDQINIIPHGSGNRINPFDDLDYNEDTHVITLKFGSTISNYDSVEHIMNGYNTSNSIRNENFHNLYSIRHTLQPRYEFKL